MGAERVCTKAPEIMQDEAEIYSLTNMEGIIGIKGCEFKSWLFKFYQARSQVLLCGEVKNLYLLTSNKTTVKEQNACLTHPDRSAMAGLLL
ncbi:C7orf77 isoform 1 [Pongo abelii]|uniref:C7orf77 isoform 1 n=1 Tax=Pongo abelii TaxID=9601 RepID=A0A2J8U4V1_PONAB|nr:C7orf77 isoform 1 [Pongo abelii]